jgi:hypothetical protein
MPLVEPRSTIRMFLIRELRRRMEVFAVDALNLEVVGQAVMIRRHSPATQNVNLRLARDGHAGRDTHDINSIVCGEDILSACVSELATGFRIEAFGQSVLLCWIQRFWLLFEDKHLVLVESIFDYFELSIYRKLAGSVIVKTNAVLTTEIVQINSVHLRAEIHAALVLFVDQRYHLDV